MDSTFVWYHRRFWLRALRNAFLLAVTTTSIWLLIGIVAWPEIDKTYSVSVVATCLVVALGFHLAACYAHWRLVRTGATQVGHIDEKGAHMEHLRKEP